MPPFSTDIVMSPGDGFSSGLSTSSMDIITQAMRGAKQVQSAEDERLVTALVNDFKWYAEIRRSVAEPIWNECYRLYRLQNPDQRRSGEWRSKINVPYAFTNVEDVVPHMMAAIFEADPLFKITSDKDPKMAEAHSKLIHHQVTEQMKLELKWLQFQKQKAIYGHTFGFTGFKYETRDKRVWTPVPNPMDPTQQVLQAQRKNMPEYVGPYFENIDIFNVWVDPRATPGNPKRKYWREWRSLSWLKKAGIFKNLEMLQDIAPSKPNDTLYGTVDVRNTLIGSMNMQQQRYQTPNEYSVTLVFNMEDRTMQAYVEDKVLIYDGDMLYWHDRDPILEDRFTILSSEYYGMGVIEPTISLIHEGNTIRNQRRDNLNLIINSALEININDIDMDETELVSRPGQIYYSRTGLAVRPIQYADVTQGAYIEENKIAGEIKGITGLGGALSGAADPEKAAASAISLTQKAQLLRLRQANKQQAAVFREFISQVFALNCQFYPLPMVKDILSPLLFEQYYALAPETIALEANITVEPAGVYENDDILRQQLTNLTNVLGSNPMFAQEIDWHEWLMKVLKAYGVEDVPSVLKKNGTLDFAEIQFAHQENIEMAEGAYVPPALPTQNENIHMEIHQSLLNARPDLFQSVGQHLMTHQQAIAQRAQLMMMAQQGGGGGGNGPGSSPAGGKGGVNHNRQPDSSSQEGVHKQVARTANANA